VASWRAQKISHKPVRFVKLATECGPRCTALTADCLVAIQRRQG